jgi:hypothetical protein
MTRPRYKKCREGRRKKLTAQHTKHLIDALASALLAVPVLHRHAVANVLRRERQLWKWAAARTHERIQTGRKERNALAPNLPRARHANPSTAHLAQIRAQVRSEHPKGVRRMRALARLVAVRLVGCAWAAEPGCRGGGRGRVGGVGGGEGVVRSGRRQEIRYGACAGNGSGHGRTRGVTWHGRGRVRRNGPTN